MQTQVCFNNINIKIPVHIDDGLSCHHVEYNFLYLLHVTIIDDRRHKNKNNFTWEEKLNDLFLLLS